MLVTDKRPKTINNFRREKAPEGVKIANPLVSIIVPVFNEQESLVLFFEEFKKIWSKLNNKYDYELIFVNDGSADNSSRIIDIISRHDRRVEQLEFSRNFGKEIAITAGLQRARGACAIMIDGDLQHPIELIPDFLSCWQKGYDVVVGVRRPSRNDGLVKRLGSYAFYKIMHVISENKLIPRSTDFRLVDRQVIDEFGRFTERNRISRGLLDWLGFKKDYIYFDACPRRAGQPGYKLFKLTRLALFSFVSHSLIPLMLAGYLGIFIIVGSGLFGIFIIVEKYVLNDPLNLNFSGPAILAILNLFLIGIVLSALGLIALYIANIHSEVINRPLYVVRKKR